MYDRSTAMERAFEYAGSGKCTSILELRQRLKSEVYDLDTITGRTLIKHKHLRKLMQLTKADPDGKP